MQGPTRAEEVSKETQEVIRFLIQDHAFDVEFLITAIQEYFHRNSAAQSKTPEGHA
jgi:hypothetical protein